MEKLYKLFKNFDDKLRNQLDKFEKEKYNIFEYPNHNIEDNIKIQFKKKDKKNCFRVDINKNKGKIYYSSNYEFTNIINNRNPPQPFTNEILEFDIYFFDKNNLENIINDIYIQPEMEKNLQNNLYINFGSDKKKIHHPKMLEVLNSIKENIKKIFHSSNGSIDVNNFVSLRDLIKKDLDDIIPLCLSPFLSSNEKDKISPEFIQILENIKNKLDLMNEDILKIHHLFNKKNIYEFNEFLKNKNKIYPNNNDLINFKESKNDEIPISFSNLKYNPDYLSNSYYINK